MNAAPQQPQARKKERKLSVVFRHSAADQHVAGIEALATGRGAGSPLYTASRDSLVKRWNVSGGRPVCEATFEGHTDWVNDCLLFGDRLVTCSSDRTVKIWQQQDARCLHTVQHHTDYVTCLAGSEAANKVVSAGLHSEVILYDMQTMQAHLLFPTPSSSSSGTGGAASSHSCPEAPHVGPGGPGPSQGGQAAEVRSVYALDMSRAGTVVAAGSTEAAIRLLDPRSGQKIAKLKGHTDNIRCLLLNPEASLLLSGSSDNTVRLWDIGQQRCIQTLNVHTDSVWCLAAAQDFSVVYSGGRDRNVYCTHLGLRKAVLLAREEQPVRDIALADGGTRLWVATTSASVAGYSLPADHAAALAQQAPAQPGHAQQARTQLQQQQPAREQQEQHGAPQPALGPSRPQAAASPIPAARSVSSGLGRHIFGTSPSLRLRQSLDPGQLGEVPLLQPSLVIEGSPGLVALRVLHDRRHVLSQDSRGEVQLWDVLAGRPIQQLGKVDLAATERHLHRPLYVEPWFTADVKLGALSVNLEPPRCFAAEVYALDLGLQGVPDDQKLNLGACLLRSALSTWGHAYSQRHMSGAPLPGLDDPGGEQLPRFSVDMPPAVVSTAANGIAWRLSAAAFSGEEREDADLPQWACDAVLRGQLPYVKELKAAFVLYPAEGSGLPSLLQSRLNAPRILQVMKVANYCVTKLAELSVRLATHEVGLTPETQLPPAPGPGQPDQQQPQQYLELTCNGMAVPYSLSIASVKKLLWKRSDDVIFHYRVLDPARPAPFPSFAPPSDS